MSEFFLTVFNMSVAATWAVPIVLLLRFPLKKAPKWITVLLWSIIAIRLICPFSFESALSLIPSAEAINPRVLTDNFEINTGVSFINNTINPIIQNSDITISQEKSVNVLKLIVQIFSKVWIIGIIGMLLYSVISYFRIKSKISTAVLLTDNIFQSENVPSPFVLGIIKPKIYLPFNINEPDINHVTAHEKAHIKRGDHLWKPIGFLILTLHWFNPVMWLSYILLCRDIELACDEKVIANLQDTQKSDYSQVLLNCSVNRRVISACPLAFGEVSVKSRVKSVLNYKKPTFWIIIVSVVACIIVAVCFLTNPVASIDNELAVFLDCQIMEHHSSDKEDNFSAIAYDILGMENSNNKTTIYMWVLYHEYSFENGEIKLESGAHLPTVITAEKTGTHGHYKLVEYWVPRDGNLYSQDIKEKFPWYLQSKALDSQSYIYKQRTFCEKAAKEYFSTISIPDFSDVDNSTIINSTSVNTFKPIDLVYDDGRYSFVQTVDTAPIYMLTDEFQLFEIRDGNISESIGYFENIVLDEDNFDSRFSSYPEYSWISDETLNNLKDNNKYLWQLYHYSSTDISELYILLEQKDGTFYIGYGYYNCNGTNPVNSDDSHIRWLYKLESTSFTDVGGADGPINIVTSTDIETLKNKFPMYFDLNTSKGLEVYIWQMAENSYSCGLLPSKDTDYTQEELWNLHKAPASLEEMRAIVMSYIPEIVQNKITVLPVVMPHSSYLYTIDETYKENLNKIFWETNPVLESTGFSYGIDTAVFDIDGDGINEQCTLNHGPTSGIFTFTFYVTENGKPEYFNIFHSKYLNLRFEKNEEGIMMLIGENEGEIHYMTMYIDGENIVITSDRQDLIYWGEQGINSVFAPKS